MALKIGGTKKKVDRVGYIYELKNTLDDKGYVGQTVREPEIRWAEHIHAAFVLNDQRPLYRAMRRDGIENFTGDVLLVTTESKLNAVERRFVRQRKTFIDTGWGYNLTTGGDCFRLSKRSRRKLARSIRRAFANDPTIALRLREALVKFYSDPAQRERLSEMKLADWAKPNAVRRHRLKPKVKTERDAKVRATLKNLEVRSKLAVAIKASYDRDPTRTTRLSESLKAAHAKDPSIRITVGLKLRGRKNTPAQTNKTSEATKAQWADPAKREVLLAALRLGQKKRWENPAEHAKMSAIHAENWKDPEFKKRQRAAIRRGKAKARKERKLANA